MKHILTLIFAITICNISQSAEEDAVCKVIIKTSRGTGNGSGTHIGNGLVLTIHHLIRNRPNAQLTCEFHNGPALPASVVYTWRAGDVPDGPLLLKVNAPQNLPSIPIARGPPPAGAAVTVYGYPRGQWKVVQDSVLPIRARMGDAGNPVNLISIRQPTWFGTSGGPLVYRGEVTGICSVSGGLPTQGKSTTRIMVAQASTGGMFVSTEHIHDAMDQYAAKKPKQQAIVFSHSRCAGCIRLENSANARGAKNLRFVKRDKSPAEYRRLWTQFESEMRQAGKPLPTALPVTWVPGTQSYIATVSITAVLNYAARYLGKIITSLLDPLLPPRERVALPDEQRFSPVPDDPEPEVYDVESLQDLVDQMRKDIESLAAAGKSTKEKLDGFSEKNIIGKARVGMAVKGDIAELKERVGNIKDGASELRTALKTPSTYSSLLLFFVSYFYRKRRAA